MSSSLVLLKTRRVEERCMLNMSRAEMPSRWCGVVVRRGDASSNVVLVTWPQFKITRSVAKSPRVTKERDVNVHLPTHPSLIDFVLLLYKIHENRSSHFPKISNPFTIVPRKVVMASPLGKPPRHLIHLNL
ncbi:uncharacterized protein TNCV_2690341 [Trichonephila clavipes]|uniref:Uncharacterized protein n=1 Tax=Trichonephila clavipes TaxID=2585209 RepID=A0A8X7BAH0_TRICX|nr:uncharacterized protein TNCV_2690341 [Trichonephila clavipes]